MDYRFDAYRTPIGNRLKDALGEIINRLQEDELLLKKRRRRRKQNDQKVFEDCIIALVCEATYHHLLHPDEWISISLSHRDLEKRSRYDSKNFGSRLSDNLEMLAAPEAGFIEMQKGKREHVVFPNGMVANASRLTTFRAGPLLLTWIREQGISLDDIGYEPDGETIILKAEKTWAGDGGEWLKYEDTPYTENARMELADLNRWLAASDLSYAGDQRVSSRDRHLKRYFTDGEFDRGGRLFGGFWQSLSKEDRKRNIKIEGEDIVELDYGQMATRIMYALVRARPPEGDLYVIPGYEKQREGIKLIINSALSAGKPQTRMPSGGRKHFAQNIKYPDVLDAVSKYHSPIAGEFFKDRSGLLMHWESEVLVEALLRGIKQGIVALPIHDAVVVPRSRKQEMKQAMRDAYWGRLGQEPVIRASDD